MYNKKYHHEYYLKNREKILSYLKKWNKKNKGYLTLYNASRYKREVCESRNAAFKSYLLKHNLKEADVNRNDLRFCSKCGVYKLVSEFYGSASGKMGYSKRCKECYNRKSLSKYKKIAALRKRELTYEEIGGKFKISKQRVEQVIKFFRLDEGEINDKERVDRETCGIK